MAQTKTQPVEILGVEKRLKAFALGDGSPGAQHVSAPWGAAGLSPWFRAPSLTVSHALTNEVVWAPPLAAELDGRSRLSPASASLLSTSGCDNQEAAMRRAFADTLSQEVRWGRLALVGPLPLRWGPRMLVVRSRSRGKGPPL